MLESEIKKLTSAVEVLTATLTGNKVAAALSEKTAKPAKKKPAQASPAAATPTVDPLDALAITPKVEPAVEAPAAPAEPVEAATKDAVIQATIKLAKAKGRDAPVPIFTTFGIKKATECDEARYGELVAALTAALA